MVWLKTHGKIPVALTIAGSDSGGGAGIEADLKAFAAMGVHGTVALTAITAQNTVAVTGVQDVSIDIIRKQIEAVVEDLGVDAAKTGMLHTSEIIEAVADEVEKHGFPLVVDPVMIAKSGAPLLKLEARDTLVRRLLPLATVVTPNAPEAEAILGVKIRSVEDLKRAAEAISRLGPEAVVAKGGHIGGKEAVDILFFKGRFYEFRAPRIESRATHGTGCSFSAAIAAGLAKGLNVVEAVKEAKRLITLAVRYGLEIGRGHGPVNPMAVLYVESEKWRTYSRVREAVDIVESEPLAARLIPEVGMNIVMALPGAEKTDEVVGIPGRIVRSRGRPRAVSSPEFGGSSHLARYIIAAMKHSPDVRAAINIRFSTSLVKKLADMGLTVSYYDRREEPEEVKAKEGATVPWGVEQAVKRTGRVPDVIYHRGDWGKEPMIVLLGEDPVKLAEIVVSLARDDAHES